MEKKMINHANVCSAVIFGMYEVAEFGPPGFCTKLIDQECEETTNKGPKSGLDL